MGNASSTPPPPPPAPSLPPFPVYLPVEQECRALLKYGAVRQHHNITYAARPNYYSQVFQDWVVASITTAVHNVPDVRSLVSHPAKRFVYVDLATNDAKYDSNSFFFDRCLHWRGLCIEPNPIYHPKIQKIRRCKLERTCISDRVQTVQFALDGGLGARSVVSVK